MPESYLPDYARVAEAIRNKIRTGEYPPGSKLPTKRELAVLHKVRPQSIDSAMIALRAEGWVRGEQGRGVYVTDDPPIADHASD